MRVKKLIFRNLMNTFLPNIKKPTTYTFPPSKARIKITSQYTDFSFVLPLNIDFLSNKKIDFFLTFGCYCYSRFNILWNKRQHGQQKTTRGNTTCPATNSIYSLPCFFFWFWWYLLSEYSYLTFVGFQYL